MFPGSATFQGFGFNPIHGAAHPTYGVSHGYSSLPYVIGERNADGGIYNSPFAATGLPKEPFTAPGSYNPHKFARPWKRRVNLLSIVQVVSILLVIFALTAYLFGFGVHYTTPGFLWLWSGFCGLLVLVFLIKAILVWRKQRSEELTVLWYLRQDDTTWFWFLAGGIFISWLAGIVCGSIIYDVYTHQYYALTQLHTYKDVDPVGPGKAYMDIGAVTFRKDSYVDISNAVGYKDGSVYCVAPVKYGNESVAQFDFWAVGIDCCNGFPGDFNCFADRNDKAYGGLRVIDNEPLPMYKLAVQSAAAEWGKVSPNPIFIEWMADPTQKIQSYRQSARTWYAICVVVFAFLEFATIGAMTMHYWRNKQWG